MSAMPRPRKPYIQREVTRHGKTIWYFRRGKENRIRLPGAFGSPEFNAAYDAALAGQPIERRTTAPRSSLRWLVDRYYESGRYSRLADNTQKNQRLALEIVCSTGAQLNFRAITRKDIMAGKVRREAKPHSARAYVQVMRAIFDFAIESGWVEVNPAEGIKAKMPRSEGHHTWTMEEVLKFQTHFPLGTKPRLAMDILLYTGLRMSDAVKIGPQHIRDGYIVVKTQKTKTDLHIPILPPLMESIRAANIDGLLFLPAIKGGQWRAPTASMWFSKCCREAGVSGSAHGLRKAGATFAAENGATPHELAAMYGWASTQMAEVYTRKADKNRLAERAANKLFPTQ
ncbi:tyrosine-type recombinase/integrase [Brucellaceae bacterium D45D]